MRTSRAGTDTSGSELWQICVAVGGQLSITLELPSHIDVGI